MHCRRVRKFPARHLLAGACVAVLFAAGPVSVEAQDGVPAQVANDQAFDIGARGLADALTEFGLQSGLQISYAHAQVQGLRSAPVKGRYRPAEALKALLDGTGMQFSFVNASTVLVKPAGGAGPDAPRKREVATPPKEGAKAADGDVVGMPAIMVKGARTLNMDIERTADDPQPYVVFDRQSIERSGASNLNEFLMTRLPMNAAAISPMAADIGNGNFSSVNLRGLGESQTLILIDGRRAATTTPGFNSGQTDVNGIPLEAIERIEVLPTTASAIYGGSATGGVINIIMRRDYVGTQVAVTYDNSFDSDSAVKRVEVSSGFSLLGGRTSVLLTGSYVESNALLNRDRDFAGRGREAILENAPMHALPLGVGTNIRSATGADLVLKDGTLLGSAFTWVPEGYGGFASDAGAALLARAGAYDLRLNNASSGKNSSGSTGGGASLAGGGPPVKYFSGSVRHEFSDRLKGFLEVSSSENNTRIGGPGVILPANIPATAPGNPFQQDIQVSWVTGQLDSYIETESRYRRYGVGLVFQITEDWMSSLDYTLTKSTWSYRDTTPFFGFGTATPFVAAVLDGTIDPLRNFDAQGLDASRYLLAGFTSDQSPLDVVTRNPALRVGGPIGQLKAGRPWLSLLLERQNSTFGSSIARYGAFEGSGSGIVRIFPERSRDVDSAYLELRVPLLSNASGIPWVEGLELQVANRWDKYTTRNAAPIIAEQGTPVAYISKSEEKVSPLVAFKLDLDGGLALRASYGKGFLPPDINALTAATLDLDSDMSWVTDPRRGDTPIPGLITQISGGNPDLKSEDSTSWSAGLIYTPAWLDGLRLSLDYTRIRKTNNIVMLLPAQLLNYEEYFGGRVVRGERLPGDPEGWSGPITSIDWSRINAARTDVEAYDLRIDYTLHTTAIGSFSFLAAATWQTQYDVQIHASAPAEDYTGWSWEGFVNAFDVRGNLGVEWSRGAWVVGWNARYSSPYYVTNPSGDSSSSNSVMLAQGRGGRVPSQVYHDVFGRYTFSAARHAGIWAGLLDGLDLQIGLRNVFNKAPPYDVTSRYYYYSGLGDPRLATYYVTLRKSF